MVELAKNHINSFAITMHYLVPRRITPSLNCIILSILQGKVNLPGDLVLYFPSIPGFRVH